MIVSLQRVHSRPWTPALRCLLVVAAWQAPLPFWHNHGTLAAASAEAATWLPGHLWHHHAAVDPLATVAFGWHLHFSFPATEDEAPDPFRQPGETVIDLASWDGFARFQSPAEASAADDWLITARVASVRPRLGMLRRAGGFFANFASEMPLPVRLGVLRC